VNNQGKSSNTQREIENEVDLAERERMRERENTQREIENEVDLAERERMRERERPDLALANAASGVSHKEQVVFWR